MRRLIFLLALMMVGTMCFAQRAGGRVGGGGSVRGGFSAGRVAGGGGYRAGGGFGYRGGGSVGFRGGFGYARGGYGGLGYGGWGVGFGYAPAYYGGYSYAGCDPYYGYDPYYGCGYAAPYVPYVAPRVAIGVGVVVGARRFAGDGQWHRFGR